MKKLCILLAFVLLTGMVVSATDGDHPMDAALKTWIGVKAKEVVKEWGDPTDIIYEQGQTKYIWQEEKARFIPGTQYQKRFECNRIFIVDTSGRVVFTKFTGNGCPFTSESAKEYVNPKVKSRYYPEE